MERSHRKPYAFKRVLELALAFARGPVHLKTHHHHLPPHSFWVVLRPVIEAEPEAKSEPEPVIELEPDPAVAHALVVGLALVAVHGTAIVCMIVATTAVEKIPYGQSTLCPPARPPKAENI